MKPTDVIVRYDNEAWLISKRYPDSPMVELRNVGGYRLTSLERVQVIHNAQAGIWCVAMFGPAPRPQAEDKTPDIFGGG